MECQVVDPLRHAEWDALLTAHRDCSVFHTSGWARVLHDTYGYAPHYFMVSDGAHASVLVPMMEVSSWLTGRRAVSLPFSDYCTPLAPDAESLLRVFDEMVRVGQLVTMQVMEQHVHLPVPRAAGFAINTSQLPSEAEDAEAYAELAQRRGFFIGLTDGRGMVTHRFPIERAQEAFDLFDSRRAGKVVFVWP